MTAKPLTHWRTRDESTADPDSPEAVDEAVTQEDAEALWAAMAHVVLSDVAGTYQGLITHNELAAQLQQVTGVHTRGNASTWIDRVLRRAAALDVEEGRPPLTALAVHKMHGTVGASYQDVMRLRGEDPIDDELARERHAAEARMECYRWAGATLPAGGGHASLSPRYDMLLTRGRRRAREDAEPTICPTCFMKIPPTGVCDTCG